MTAADLIAELSGRGITLSLHGEHLCAEGPQDQLTPDLAPLLRENKAELIRELVAQEVDLQVDRLEPHNGADGQPCLIHRELLQPERCDDLETLELVSWALNRNSVATPPLADGKGTNREATTGRRTEPSVRHRRITRRGDQ